MISLRYLFGLMTVFLCCSLARAGLVEDLVSAAKERTKHDVTYDGSYVRIGYPNGDVPENKGVCTDVVIRSYRKVGIDLQVEVHRDIKTHFNLYPKIWGLSKPDPNIDHRRVPNLQVFFKRKGCELPVSHRAEDYRSGDLVTWMLPGNQPHIGIVVDQKTWHRKRYLIVHNIGRGPKLEDALFDFPITGHYRYLPGINAN
jgi:uncharacterized protein YijF (DUF1287 family)